MIDYHKQLVSALEEILPKRVHHELTLHSGLKTPCISYSEDDNSDIAVGDTLAYSNVSYIVKVWASANDIGQIQHYAVQVSDALRKLGFTRTSSGELWDTERSMCQKIMIFKATGFERF